MKTALEQIDPTYRLGLEREWIAAAKTQPNIYLGLSFENYLVYTLASVCKERDALKDWLIDREQSMKRMEVEINGYLSDQQTTMTDEKGLNEFCKAKRAEYEANPPHVTSFPMWLCYQLMKTEAIFKASLATTEKQAKVNSDEESETYKKYYEALNGLKANAKGWEECVKEKDAWKEKVSELNGYLSDRQSRVSELQDKVKELEDTLWLKYSSQP
jgi:hypothetical protein